MINKEPDPRCSGCEDVETCPTARMPTIFCTGRGVDKEVVVGAHPAVRDGNEGDAPMSCETAAQYEQLFLWAQRLGVPVETLMRPLIPVMFLENEE